MAIRIGQGFDVHAFCDGDHVMLGGVRIPFDRGLKAHSDGDVALHALADRLADSLDDPDRPAHTTAPIARELGRVLAVIADLEAVEAFEEEPTLAEQIVAARERRAAGVPGPAASKRRG